MLNGEFVFSLLTSFAYFPFLLITFVICKLHAIFKLKFIIHKFRETFDLPASFPQFSLYMISNFLQFLQNQLFYNLMVDKSGIIYVKLGLFSASSLLVYAIIFVILQLKLFLYFLFLF